MALTVACAHCSGLGAACVSFGTGRSAHAFILSPLVPVVGVLCSAQSHAIPAASRFFILAPSGPCERQLRCTERPLLASQPHTPAPDRAPSSQQARPPRLPPSSPNERTCEHKTEHAGPPTAKSLPGWCEQEPWPPPSCRHPLSPHPRPLAVTSHLTSSPPPTTWASASCPPMAAQWSAVIKNNLSLWFTSAPAWSAMRAPPVAPFLAYSIRRPFFSCNTTT